MKRVVIVDTWGEQALHPEYRSRLPHVTFVGHSPRGWGSQPAHGHGGWCAWDWLSQETEPVECHLVQMFGPGGEGTIDDGWWMDVLAGLALGPEDGVNCSWGGGSASHYDKRWLAAFRRAIGGATCYFAAGNDGREEQEYPQRALMGSENVIIVAAIDRTGKRAEFSSSAGPGGRYPDLAMLGVGAMSLDAGTGLVVAWQGTSAASPRAGGAFSALGLSGPAVRRFALAHVTGDDDADGAPNGISADWVQRIKAGEYNHEVGIGVCEALRQGHLHANGRGLGVYDGRGKSMQMAPMYHDFERI